MVVARALGMILAERLAPVSASYSGKNTSPSGSASTSVSRRREALDMSSRRFRRRPRRRSRLRPSPRRSPRRARARPPTSCATWTPASLKERSRVMHDRLAARQRPADRLVVPAADDQRLAHRHRLEPLQVAREPPGHPVVAADHPVARPPPRRARSVSLTRATRPRRQSGLQSVWTVRVSPALSVSMAASRSL